MTLLLLNPEGEVLTVTSGPSVQVLLETSMGTFADVSTYFRSGSITQGKSKELTRNSAGKLTMTFSNADRRFDPTYASGDYYGSLKPMRRIIVIAMVDGVSYPEFYGYVDGWSSQRNGPFENVATVQATDGFKVLNKKKLSSSTYVAEVLTDTPVAFWRLGEPVDSASAIDSVGGRELVAGPATVFGATGLVSRESGTSIQATDYDNGVRTDGTFILTGAPLSVEMVCRITSVATAYQFVGSVGAAAGFTLNLEDLPTFEIDNGATVTQATTTGVTVHDGAVHHIVGTWDAAGAMKVYVDGVNRTVGSPSLTAGTFVYQNGPINIGGLSGSLQMVAFYDTALSAARVAAHAEAVSTPWNGDTPAQRLDRVLDLALWPSDLRELDEGSSVLQSATLNMSALEHSQKVAESEFGEFFQKKNGNMRLIERTGLLNQTSQTTFSDVPAEGFGYRDLVPLYDDTLIRNPVTVSRLEGVAQTVQDDDGIEEYLNQDYTIDGLYHNDDGFSRDAAEFLVSEYKDPKRRIIGMTVGPTADTELLTEMLAREIGEWITVIEHPQGVGSAITQVSVIQGISHTFSPKEWVTKWNLSPAVTGAFLQLDNPNVTIEGANPGRIFF